MTVEEAVALLIQQIKRSSLRRVAERVGVSHGTVRGWSNGATPEGRARELLLAWAEQQSASPSSASGMARTVLAQLEDAVRRQRELVRLLEEGATTEQVEIIQAADDPLPEDEPATPTAAAPAAARRRGAARG